jgi:hypothetical protein
MLSPQRLTLLLCVSLAVVAQPSPEQQKRITEAIQNAADNPNPDYTAFVNPFIGTGEPFFVFIMQNIWTTLDNGGNVWQVNQ